MELRCAYCESVVDETKPYWVLERWENGRAVARGFANHIGCLHAVAAFQGPRRTPLTKGALTPIEPSVD